MHYDEGVAFCERFGYFFCQTEKAGSFPVLDPVALAAILNGDGDCGHAGENMETLES